MAEPVNPRKDKKFLFKALGKDKELYKVFLKLYDEAVLEGSTIPYEVAWIRFREMYVETDDSWMRV